MEPKSSLINYSSSYLLTNAKRQIDKWSAEKAFLACTIGLPVMVVGAVGSLLVEGGARLYHALGGTKGLEKRVARQISPTCEVLEPVSTCSPPPIGRYQLKITDKEPAAGSDEKSAQGSAQLLRKTLTTHKSELQAHNNPGKGNCGHYAVAQWLTQWIKDGHKFSELPKRLSSEESRVLTQAVHQYRPGATDIERAFADLELHEQSDVLRQLAAIGIKNSRTIPDLLEQRMEASTVTHEQPWAGYLRVFNRQKNLAGGIQDLGTWVIQKGVDLYCQDVRTRNGLPFGPLAGAGALYADFPMEIVALGQVFGLNMWLDNDSYVIPPEPRNSAAPDVILRRHDQYGIFKQPHFELLTIPHQLSAVSEITASDFETKRTDR